MNIADGSTYVNREFARLRSPARTPLRRRRTRGYDTLMDADRRSLTLALLLAAALPAGARAADAVLAAVTGRATVVVAGARSPAVAKAALPPGGKVMTAAGATVLVLLADGSKIRVAENSVFAFESESKTDTNVRLLKGLLTAWIRPQGGRRLAIGTPSAVASVRGTVLTATVGDDTVSFDLFSGALWITDRFGKSTMMTEGQRTDVRFDHGIVGTAVLPAGASAPEEPTVDGGPSPSEKTHTETDEALEHSAGAVEVDAAEDYAESGTAPPTPTQNQSVVSPSAP